MVQQPAGGGAHSNKGADLGTVLLLADNVLTWLLGLW